jgi:predicted transcriptional regulator
MSSAGVWLAKDQHMTEEKIAQPTDAELEILRVLWERGPSTVREVHEVISRTKPAGYTTVLKLLQIMTEKGLVRRNEEQRAHVYEPRLAKEQTQRQLLGDLLERAFGGSAAELVMQALSTKKASPDELASIRQILNELEEGK